MGPQISPEAILLGDEGVQALLGWSHSLQGGAEAHIIPSQNNFHALDLLQGKP